jgi:hypothetical protein
MQEKIATVNPLEILKASVRAWIGCLLPAAAVSCVSVFLARLLRLNIMSGLQGREPSLIAAGTFFFQLVVFFVVNAVVSLLILSLMRMNLDGNKEATLQEAWRAAMQALLPYLRVLVGLMLCAATILGAGATVLTLGQNYCGTCGVDGFKLAVLLTTSTVFVTLVIALFWYGFFLSLAPLIAVFEGRGPVTAIKESRRRVKRHPGAYLAALVLFLALYVLIGVGIYLTLTRFTSERLILNMIDPFLAAFLGPLWLAIWYVSYKRLSVV